MDKLDITYYTADWCVPCQTFKPVMEAEVAKRGYSLRYIDVQRDNLEGIEVMSVPLIVVRRGKRVLGQFNQAMTANRLRLHLDEFQQR